MLQKFYLTTPLYYVNDIPHIGHAYTTIAADVLARYKRAACDVHFLTGTDEHGQKIYEAAEKAGKSAQEFVDGMVSGFKSAWKTLGISYDDFIRTTEKRHETVVQNIFKKLLEQGDIYKGEYEGWYCVPCESYVADRKCPDCGRETKKIKEESYFFKQSKYGDQLLRHIEKHPGFIQPESRRNEMRKFIKQGLKDLSVTRTTFSWGVPVPSDPKHVVYVWFDALINYVSALGYNPALNSFEKPVWPADVHLMGKEIVRFHAVTWPCLLMALGIELPKKIFGHGWWTVEGQKMSKSKGNVVDPLVLSSEFGVDAVRYFLLREVPFGADGDFSLASFKARYNADLANDIGNLLSRTLTMVDKYFKSEILNPKFEIPTFPCGKSGSRSSEASTGIPTPPCGKSGSRSSEASTGIPTPPCGKSGSRSSEASIGTNSKLQFPNFDDLSQELTELMKETPKAVDQAMNNLAFSEALAAVWKLINKANNYIEKEAPWKISKAGETDKLAAVIFNLCEALKVSAVLISPFMPETAKKMWQQLGLPLPLSLETPLAGVKVAKGQPLFPRSEK